MLSSTLPGGEACPTGSNARKIERNVRVTAMVIVADVCAVLDQLAPLAHAEEWDNVGLLLGDKTVAVRGIMTCLTVTPDSVREAIDRGASLIVSHHPIFFRAT